MAQHAASGGGGDALRLMSTPHGKGLPGQGSAGAGSVDVSGRELTQAIYISQENIGWCYVPISGNRKILGRGEAIPLSQKRSVSYIHVSGKDIWDSYVHVSGIHPRVLCRCRTKWRRNMLYTYLRERHQGVLCTCLRKMP